MDGRSLERVSILNKSYLIFFRRVQEVTEESMSRHVKKCSKRLANPSHAYPFGGLEQRNSKRKKEKQCYKTRMPKIVNFSDEDKERRQNALQIRSQSFGKILAKGNKLSALDAVFTAIY